MDAASREAEAERALDIKLTTLGYYRKAIAKDGACLFRAVSEQLFVRQVHHRRVRQECVEYMRAHADEFSPFVEQAFDHYLFELAKPGTWGTQVEMEALSRRYECDFVIYQVDGAPYQVTHNGHTRKVCLGYTYDNHYDSVYPLEWLDSAAVCQGLIQDMVDAALGRPGQDSAPAYVSTETSAFNAVLDGADEAEGEDYTQLSGFYRKDNGESAAKVAGADGKKKKKAARKDLLGFQRAPATEQGTSTPPRVEPQVKVLPADSAAAFPSLPTAPPPSSADGSAPPSNPWSAKTLKWGSPAASKQEPPQPTAPAPAAPSANSAVGSPSGENSAPAQASLSEPDAKNPVTVSPAPSSPKPATSFSEISAIPTAKSATLSSPPAASASPPPHSVTKTPIPIAVNGATPPAASSSPTAPCPAAPAPNATQISAPVVGGSNHAPPAPATATQQATSAAQKSPSSAKQPNPPVNLQPTKSVSPAVPAAPLPGSMAPVASGPTPAGAWGTPKSWSGVAANLKATPTPSTAKHAASSKAGGEVKSAAAGPSAQGNAGAPSTSSAAKQKAPAPAPFSVTPAQISVTPAPSAVSVQGENAVAFATVAPKTPTTTTAAAVQIPPAALKIEPPSSPKSTTQPPASPRTTPTPQSPVEPTAPAPASPLTPPSSKPTAPIAPQPTTPPAVETPTRATETSKTPTPAPASPEIPAKAKTPTSPRSPKQEVAAPAMPHAPSSPKQPSSKPQLPAPGGPLLPTPEIPVPPTPQPEVNFIPPSQAALLPQPAPLEQGRNYGQDMRGQRGGRQINGSNRQYQTDYYGSSQARGTQGQRQNAQGQGQGQGGRNMHRENTSAPPGHMLPGTLPYNPSYLGQGGVRDSPGNRTPPAKYTNPPRLQQQRRGSVGEGSVRRDSGGYISNPPPPQWQQQPPQPDALPYEIMQAPPQGAPQMMGMHPSPMGMPVHMPHMVPMPMYYQPPHFPPGAMPGPPPMQMEQHAPPHTQPPLENRMVKSNGMMPSSPPLGPHPHPPQFVAAPPPPIMTVGGMTLVPVPIMGPGGPMPLPMGMHPAPVLVQMPGHPGPYFQPYPPMMAPMPHEMPPPPPPGSQMMDNGYGGEYGGWQGDQQRYGGPPPNDYRQGGRKQQRRPSGGQGGYSRPPMNG